MREIERALEVGRVLGATCSLHVKEGYPLLRNDPRVTDAVRTAAIEAIGAPHVVDLPYSTWAEDFAYIAATRPRIDVLARRHVARRRGSGLAQPGRSTIDEDALPIGATVFAARVVPRASKLTS